MSALSASRKRQLVLKDLEKVSVAVVADAAKLHKKLKTNARKSSLENSARVLKFHVDRLINNNSSSSRSSARLIMRTRQGKPLYSIADLR